MCDNLVDTHVLLLVLWVYAWTSSLWEKGLVWVDELIDTIGSTLKDSYKPIHWISKRMPKKQVHIYPGKGDNFL